MIFLISRHHLTNASCRTGFSLRYKPAANASVSPKEYRFAMLSETFSLLSQEAYLTRSSLLTGFTHLRKANIGDDTKGLFYSSFFQLSIGFERLMKLILVVDYMAKNDLKPMTDEELRNKYSHKIKNLYKGCMSLASDQGMSLDEFVTENEFDYEIVSFLHEFALSARYYNLSKLSNSQKSKDPLSEWWSILSIIMSSDVPYRKRKKIEEESVRICDAIGNNTFTMMRGLDQQLMTTLDTIVYPQFIEAASPYVVWRTFRVIKPLYSLIDRVVDEVHVIEQQKGHDYPLVPYLYEFFPFLLLDRGSVIRRKKWG